MTNVPSDKDAYTQPRVIQPGCQHQLGCKCEPPFWLRDSTEPELRHYNIPKLPTEKV